MSAARCWKWRDWHQSPQQPAFKLSERDRKPGDNIWGQGILTTLQGLHSAHIHDAMMHEECVYDTEIRSGKILCFRSDLYKNKSLFIFPFFPLTTVLVRDKMNNILKVCDLVNGCSPCTYLFKILHHCFISFHHSNRMRKIHQGFSPECSFWLILVQSCLAASCVRLASCQQ